MYKSTDSCCGLWHESYCWFSAARFLLSSQPTKQPKTRGKCSPIMAWENAPALPRTPTPRLFCRPLASEFIGYLRSIPFNSRLIRRQEAIGHQTLWGVLGVRRPPHGNGGFWGVAGAPPRTLPVQTFWPLNILTCSQQFCDFCL